MSRRARGEPRPAPDVQSAVEIGLGYLATRPRSRWEVERRLRRAATGEEVIEAALERLTELGYLDDVAFARWWTEQRDRHAPRGRRLLEAELRARGVPREVIEQVRDESRLIGPAEPEPVEAPARSDDSQRARMALDRHLRGRPMPSDPKALHRLGMFLMRRGFDPETVRETLRAAATDEADA
jgi:regulatory protein